ncbi:hypothetical protein FQN55_006827 [Onygenales sp. PD_40]|nr:hypothetical protein FQN55_006827 [Onygenales sp. PD_40]
MDRFRRRSSMETPSRLSRAMAGALERLSPARRLENTIQEDADSAKEFKGPLGLNLLQTVPEPLIDIIFVHGLGGGSKKTWSLSPDPNHYWPKQWLGQDPEFTRVRIHSFGYKAEWGEMGKSVLNIHDFARSLLVEIRCNPDIRRSTTKIVLVAHSMGGIVIKKAYILAREDAELQDLGDRIHTLYFLATPHRGSDLAGILANILRVSYGSKPFVTELRHNSGMIASINDSFRHFANDLQLWSFYETIPSNFVFTKTMVVHKASATLDYTTEKSSPLNADHRGVCKFDQQADPNYQTLRNAFTATIDQILSEASQVRSRISNDRHRRLNELTCTFEPPVNELSDLEDIRVPGSCEWLTLNKVYGNWSTEHHASRPIFFLTGNAGSGKSILSAYAINDLLKRELKCSYFFFKHGNATRSTVATCLRALAYQMARSDDMILQRLLQVHQDMSFSSQWDEKTVWRKLYIGCIFKETNSTPAFWVIDGLDECDNFPVFLTLLAQIPSHLRILVTGRNIPAIEKGLGKLEHLVDQHQIDERDTVGDLSIFIDSRMDSFPTDDDEGREKLKSKILQKACGSFLWVSLVVKELGQVYSEEGAEEVLNEVPTDMNKVYARMLEGPANNPRAAKLARSIFMWTLLALRPLKVDELQFAIKLDTDQTVHNLDRSVPAICGQLAYVNQRNEVEIIHQTAKAYLLQQEEYPSIAVKKPQFHDRIALLCLKLLSGDFIKELRPFLTKSSYTSIPGSGFADYACESFSGHLQKCSSENSVTWDLLFKFLENNVLLWVEYLATKKSLRPISQTAKNLQAYLRRRIKYLPPFCSQARTLESWINDLIRLSAKFGANLSLSPSSIHTLIPAMCPTESVVSETYGPRHRGLSIRGLNNGTWDDCLVRIDYTTHQIVAVAQGDRYSAVAASDGTIFSYYQDSMQPKSTLFHGERLKTMTFSTEDRYLASSGRKRVKIWDMADGTLVRVIDTDHTVSRLIFTNNTYALVAATHNNDTITWDLKTGIETDRWQWIDSIRTISDHHQPSQRQPQVVVFSPDYTALAVSYRGFPIFLFDTETKKFIGCCSRQSTNPQGGIASLAGATREYFVDAMAFNPSPDINVIVVSYGDGELVLYSLESTELCYRSPGVYAHSLACSPDGRKLVTGSAQGTIQVFEFTGARGDSLSLIYRIKGHEDGIQSVVFSTDSLRFADIRGSQYRIWEPAVLACHELDEGSQSGSSQATLVEPNSVSMLDGSAGAEITTICCHPNGDFVFCGKQDGSVTYFDTRSATDLAVLYHHGANVGVTCITFVNEKGLLVTGDQSGGVVIYNVRVSQVDCEIAAISTEIRLDMTPTLLLPDPSGDRILIGGKKYAEVWTTEGEKVGSKITFQEDEDDVVMANHPFHSDLFVAVGRNGMQIYSWINALEPRLLSDDAVEVSNSKTIALPPEHRGTLQPKQRSDIDTQPNTPHFIVRLLKSKDSSNPRSTSVALKAWPASSIPITSSSPQSIPIPDFVNHAHKVRQVIGVTDNVLLFLSTNFWVCSVDLSQARDSKSANAGAQRHFFLLSEWQNSHRRFIIEYMPARREFVVATRHGLIVVSKGFEFEEPWLSSMYDYAYDTLKD